MGGLFAVLYGSVSYGLCLVTLLYAMISTGGTPKVIALGGVALRRARVLVDRLCRAHAVSAFARSMA